MGSRRKETPFSVGDLYLVELTHLLCRREVLCTLTHLLCRGWARLHWHECTLGILSRRVAPIQMHLGYSNRCQDLLWLLCMHFSSQHSNLLMTSCPWSSALRMCKKLECNQNRMLTWGSTKEAQSKWLLFQLWSTGSSTGQVWLGWAWCDMDVPALWQTQTRTWISASPELGKEYFVGWAYQQWEQKPNVCDHWSLVSTGSLFPGKSTGKNLVGLAAWSKGSRAARGSEWGKFKMFLYH